MSAATEKIEAVKVGVSLLGGLPAFVVAILFSAAVFFGSGFVQLRMLDTFQRNSDARSEDIRVLVDKQATATIEAGRVQAEATGRLSVAVQENNRLLERLLERVPQK